MHFSGQIAKFKIITGWNGMVNCLLEVIKIYLTKLINSVFKVFSRKGGSKEFSDGSNNIIVTEKQNRRK